MRSRIFQIPRKARRVTHVVRWRTKTETNHDNPVFPDFLWTEAKDENPYLLEGQQIHRLAYESETKTEFLAKLEDSNFHRLYSRLQKRWGVDEEKVLKALKGLGAY